LIPCTPRHFEEEKVTEVNKESSKGGSPLRWLGLSTCGSALLLATTNIITFDIASTPLLWVLPLTIYLLTFVLVFKSKSWFPNWLNSVAFWVLPIALVICWLSELHVVLPHWIFMVLVHLTILFVLCMCCHGTLYKERPKDPKLLTRFYLYMSLGGFSGNVIINWIIPFISDRSIEYPLTLFFSALLLTYKKSAVFNKRALVHAAIYLVLLITLFYVIGQANLALFITFSAIGLLIMVPLIITKDSYGNLLMVGQERLAPPLGCNLVSPKKDVEITYLNATRAY